MRIFSFRNVSFCVILRHFGLTVGRKMAKIFTICRKGHHPITPSQYQPFLLPSQPLHIRCSRCLPLCRTLLLYPVLSPQVPCKLKQMYCSIFENAHSNANTFVTDGFSISQTITIKSKPSKIECFM